MSKIYYGLRSASELDDFFENCNTFSEEEPYIIRVKRFTSEDIVPLHCARSFEILFSCNTRGTVTINNKAYDLDGEQVFAIPPNVVHSTTIQKCNGYLYTMQLSLEEIKKYINIEQIAMLSGLSLSDISHRCPETVPVKQIFECLIEHDRDICFCFSQILQLFSILFKHREKSSDSISSQYKKNQSVDNTLKHVLEWTLDNCTSNITIEQVASVAGYTRVYFCNWFKKKTGITYMTHLANVRNTNVCLLLKSGYNVTEACYKCGFNNLSHFVKQFKRKYGVTPRQYASLYARKNTNQTPMEERNDDCFDKK